MHRRSPTRQRPRTAPRAGWLLPEWRPRIPIERLKSMSIEIRHIDKHFGRFHALKDVNLDIASGELVALLGPSGCGKT
ncbi:ATP-binding cassette domain-containing protein, partial [Cellulomonas oligotrophica]|uniref:ATP-binding cassette domain-containing protein n=1 Tax=Cellulomonas oligotrophica TaxID=931536 RepID=UPI003CD08921